MLLVSYIFTFPSLVHSYPSLRFTVLYVLLSFFSLFVSKSSSILKNLFFLLFLHVQTCFSSFLALPQIQYLYLPCLIYSIIQNCQLITLHFHLQSVCVYCILYSRKHLCYCICNCSHLSQGSLEKEISSSRWDSPG